MIIISLTVEVLTKDPTNYQFDDGELEEIVEAVDACDDQIKSVIQSNLKVKFLDKITINVFQ